MFGKFTLYLLALFIALSVFANAGEPQISTTKDGAMYIKGTLVVKLASHVNIESVDDAQNRSNNPSAYFGIPSLDATLQPMGAIRAVKTFAGAKNFAIKKSFASNDLIRQAENLERYYKVEFDESAPLEKIIAGLKREPNVELVEYSYVYEPFEVPNDALYNTLQHLPQISAEQAWDIHKGENGPEVVIGIHDSGCQWDHPDLFANLKINYDEWTNREAPLFITQNNRLVINPAAVDGLDSDGNGFIDDVIGYNFYDWDTSPRNDPYGSTANTHGTHVAGIAAGVTNNAAGISAISWNVKFVPTRHSALTGAQYLYNVDQGLWFMGVSGVDVVNMSWGGGGYSELLIELFQFLDGIGVTLISSAGNANNEIPSYPNSYPRVMSIASVASTDARAYYSTYGIQVDVSSPGGDVRVDGGINSTYPMNTYRKLQGTSMAGPLVAGLAGLIKSYHPDWTPLQIRKQIAGTVDDVYYANPNLAGKLGSGRINAYKALSQTNVNVSTEPRIGYFETNYYNQDGSTVIKPGDDVNLSALIRNYNMFHDAGILVFKLEFNNPDVTVTSYNLERYIKADDLVNITGFSAKVSANAKPAIVYGFIRVEKQDGTLLLNIPVEFNIAGGILVYEHIPGSMHQSGTFISNELEKYGFDVVYTNTMPKWFSGFSAVFLSLGNYSQSPIFQINSQFYYAVRFYLEAGGKMFMDASSIMRGQAIPNMTSYEINSLFGISNAVYGSPNDVPFNRVDGVNGSLAQGLSYYGTTQPNGYLIEKYTPSASYGGQAMLNESTYGTVGVQTAGIFGQRFVLMSFALGGYVDNDCPSTKSVLLERIIDFMGLTKPVQISMPSNFTLCRGGEVQLLPELTYDCATDSYMNKTVTGGSGDFDYSWTPANRLINSKVANPTVVNLTQNTTFNLTVTDKILGTKAYASTVVSVVQPPNVGVRILAREKANSYVNINKYITNFSSSNTYYWYQNDLTNLISSEDESNWKVPFGTTRLYVSAQNEHGCMTSVYRMVTVAGTLNKNIDEMVSGINGNSFMSVFPTVANDELNIFAEFAEVENYSVKITDLLGNTVMQLSNGSADFYSNTHNVSSLYSGTYFIVVETKSDRIIQKFVKM